MKIKSTLLLVALVLTALNSQAQNFETILLARADASKITSAYLSPVTKGLIYTSNVGWYHTAKVHKTLGFDITIGLNAAFVPSKDELFNIPALNLSSNTSVLNGQANSPTIIANNSVTPAKVRYTSTVQGQTVQADFTLPNGARDDFPLNSVPAPAIQVGLGLPAKFEVMVRYLPKLGPDDTKLGLFGLGLKKEITDWFGPLDKTPLHVSLLGAYTNFSVNHDFGNTTGSVSTQDGTANFKLNSYTIQAIASLNFPIINVYGGFGYTGGSTKLSVDGTYTLTYQTNNPTVPTVSESITNPLALTQDAGGVTATVGARVSLGFFKLFGSYTLQEYNAVNAGISFSFR